MNEPGQEALIVRVGGRRPDGGDRRDVSRLELLALCPGSADGPNYCGPLGLLAYNVEACGLDFVLNDLLDHPGTSGIWLWFGTVRMWQSPATWLGDAEDEEEYLGDWVRLAGLNDVGMRWRSAAWWLEMVRGMVAG